MREIDPLCSLLTDVIIRLSSPAVVSIRAGGQTVDASPNGYEALLVAFDDVKTNRVVISLKVRTMRDQRTFRLTVRPCDKQDDAGLRAQD